MRFSAAGALLLALLAGCGSPEATGESRLTVYLSAPLSGSGVREGKLLVIGARNALAEAGEEAGGVPVELEILDVATEDAPWSPVTAAANARTAEQDSTSIAYLGELESGATRTSLPITNEAALLQIAPDSPAPDLVAPFEGSEEIPEETQPSGVRTFGRLANPPGDPELQGYLAAAIALDAIERSDDPLSRGAVVEAFFEPGEPLRDGGEHDSLAGPYSVDELGEIDHRGPP